MGYAIQTKGMGGCRAVDGPDCCTDDETYSLQFVERTVSITDAQTAKRAEINTGFEAALIASVTMPSINTPPSAVEVAVGAAALAAVDPDGPAYIMQTHSTRRAALLAAVDAATTVEAVQAITVSYAV